jgi:hypothetical protein
MNMSYFIALNEEFESEKVKFGNELLKILSKACLSKGGGVGKEGMVGKVGNVILFIEGNGVNNWYYKPI